MAYGITRLRQLQLYREAIAGTANTPTILWAGPAQIPEDESPRVFAEQHIGVLAPSLRSYQPAKRAVLNFPATPATFEQVVHLFEMGIDAEAATKDGAGSGYIRAYDLFSTSNAFKPYTLMGGNNQGRRQMSYSFLEQFTLSGKADEAVMIESAKARGRQTVTGVSFAALSQPTVAEILFNTGKLYINDSGGAFGGTQKTGTWLSFSLSVTTGLMAVQTGDGALYFYSVKQATPAATLQITFEHDDTAVAEKTAMESGSVRLVRMLFEGATLGTAGTTYTKKTLRIDAEGVWQPESFKTLEDQNGDDTMVGTLMIGKGTDANGLKITNVMEAATL